MTTQQLENDREDDEDGAQLHASIKNKLHNTTQNTKALLRKQDKTIELQSF